MLGIIQESCLEEEFPSVALALVFALMGQPARFGEISLPKQPEVAWDLVSKGDYAEQKYPHCARSTALKKLNRAILSSPGLDLTLRKAGYNPKAHTLTPEQVAIMERAWGKFED